MVGTRTELAVSATITAAQITAKFAPIPGLCFAGELLSTIFELAEKAASNRHAVKSLRDRCYFLLLYISELVQDKQLPDSMKDAVVEIEQCLSLIHQKMERWAGLSKIKGVLQQNEVARDIENCHESLDLCLKKLDLTSMMENHHWQDTHAANTRRDKDELLGYLSDIQNQTILSVEVAREGNAKLQEMMLMLQNMMGQNVMDASRVHHGLSNNLYQISIRSNELLPEFHLSHGEVKKVNPYPISGGGAMDIYEGLYLNNEKVAIKSIRSINNSEKSLRRFKREVDIWSRIWKADRGKHILPFYGFVQTEGPYPWMVSPWQKNGNALTYVCNNDHSVDHVRLVAGIAKGLGILHSMSIVHGDLKAANVMISDLGTPLIADFGLSKIVEDVTGVPFTQSRGVSESFRWFAPEVCVGSGRLSYKSDIYAYAMTVLELMTHQQPYSNVKHTPEVVIRTAQGELPLRPTNPRVTERGLNDVMWQTLTQCWQKNMDARPTIEAVFASFGIINDDNI